MKKTVLLLAIFCSLLITANAQILRAEELEKYAKEKYGEKWIDAAKKLGTQLTLDKNNAITYVQVMKRQEKIKNSYMFF